MGWLIESVLDGVPGGMLSVMHDGAGLD